MVKYTRLLSQPKFVEKKSDDESYTIEQYDFRTFRLKIANALDTRDM